MTESEIGNHYVGYDKIKKQDDCTLFRFKSLGFSFHKEPMGSGTGEIGNPKNTEWNYPAPNSENKMTQKSAFSGELDSPRRHRFSFFA